MDTLCSYTVDNTELKTLTWASMQTLKWSNKKCGTEELFWLLLDYLESYIDKESFDKILELLIKNWKQAVMQVTPLYQYLKMIK